MKRWLDSRPPSDAQIAAAKAAGYDGWALYHGVAGDGIAPDHLASDADFRRVLAGGLQTLAYVSGNDSPLAIRTWSQTTGILTVVDVERFIREDGPWLDSWLALSGSGLYGNGSVHFEAGQPPGRGAACNIFAGYFGYDPQATWPGWLAQPHLCGWQFRGSHAEFGMSVDSMWADDNLGGDDMQPDEHDHLVALAARAYWFLGGTADLSGIKLSDGKPVTTAAIPGVITLPELLAKIEALQPGGGESGLTQQQVTNAVTAALKTLTLKAT